MTFRSSTGDLSEPDDRELRETLDQASDLGNRLLHKGRELSAAGQYIVDWVDITRAAIPLTDSPQDLLAVNRSWHSMNSYVCNTLEHIDRIDITSLNSTSTASALTSVLTLPIYVASRTETSPQNTDAQQVARSIEELASRSREKEAVVELMQALKLDSAPSGRRSPVEQLETSYRAFEVAVDSSNPSLTSLIPMRECILQTIAILLKKRNRQEKMHGTEEKVTSIFRQLKRTSVPEELISTLSAQCKDILDNRLSSSKNLKVARLDWHHTLIVSTLWLKSFLSAIDPNKMRSTTI